MAGADVRFVLIGGMAAILDGDVGVTIDITRVYDPDRRTLPRLHELLERTAGSRRD